MDFSRMIAIRNYLEFYHHSMYEMLEFQSLKKAKGEIVNISPFRSLSCYLPVEKLSATLEPAGETLR